MKFALISALVVAAAPAFADVNLGTVSPAEFADQHGFETSFMADADLGKVSPAEIAGQGSVGDAVISTQNIDVLAKLGVTSPAERAAR